MSNYFCLYHLLIYFYELCSKHESLMCSNFFNLSASSCFSISSQQGLTIDPLKRIFGRLSASNLDSIITPSFGVIALLATLELTRGPIKAILAQYGPWISRYPRFCTLEMPFFLDLGDITEIFFDNHQLSSRKLFDWPGLQ